MLSRFNFHNEVRKRLANGAVLLFTEHAQVRMLERSISSEDVLRCVQRGMAADDPLPDMIKRSTSCRMDHPSQDGDRMISVVVGLPDERPKVIVVTVYGNKS